MCEECSRNVENMSGIAAAPEEGRGLLFPTRGYGFLRSQPGLRRDWARDRAFGWPGDRDMCNESNVHY